MTQPQALAGIRVVDFSWVRAGPWATRWLGALGAEIIKIEWPDNERGRLPSSSTPQGMEVNLNTSGNFNDTNVNKRGISLNLRSAKGLEVVRRLVAVSDVVIENYSSRVLRNWGLGYEEMRRIKPDIVYVSMSGYGHTGRNHHYTTFGPVAQSVAGLTQSSGLPGMPPAGWGWSYMDDTGGMYGVICVLSALYHRNRTGRGQHVDQSQMISAVPLNGPALLDFTANGRRSRREGFPPGNRAAWPGTEPANAYRGPTVAPHNAYRTDPGGYNDWCVIVCETEDEWRALVAVMGNPAWAGDPRFASMTGRLEHQDALDAHIEAWTRGLGKYAVTELCQAAGVRAMAVQTAEDRVEHDPQLAHRGMYLPLTHPLLGERKAQNAPFKLSATPARNTRPSPLIGEHTREVIVDLLGYSLAELRAGFEDGTFWPPKRPRMPYHAEMLA
jgi:crotonobetainyl-CoA:carnitine CoA-transferase CaiB-like acyl-CoA transferase